MIFGKLNNTKNIFFLLDYLTVYKNPSIPNLYSITGTLSIKIVSSKGFNPYITLLSPLYLLTLLKLHMQLIYVAYATFLIFKAHICDRPNFPIFVKTLVVSSMIFWLMLV